MPKQIEKPKYSDFITKKKYEDVISKAAGTKTKNFGRGFPNSTRFNLWATSGGYCSICSNDIKVFKGEENSDPNTKNSEVAHIVSANDENIRPSLERYDYFSEDDDFNDQDKKVPYGYTHEFLNSYKNLMLLCFSCHKIIDNSLSKVKTAKSKRALEIHEIKSPNEQVTKLAEIKRDNEKDITGLIPFDKIPSLMASSNEEFESIIEILDGYLDELNSYKNLKYEKISIRFTTNSIEVNDAAVHILINEFETLDFRKKYEFMKKHLKEVDFSKDDEKIAVKINFKKKNNNKYIIFDFHVIDKFGILVNQKDKKDLAKDVEKELNGMKHNFSLSMSNKLSKKSNGDDPFLNNPEILIMKKMLLKMLDEYATDDNEEFSSASIAYMARWGTGKTTAIRHIAKDLKKYYNFVEINLWHISNVLEGSGGSEDNVFVRKIVKEAITQLTNNKVIVSEYLDSYKKSSISTSSSNLKEEMLSSMLKMPLENKDIKVIQERSKFLDQFLTTLSTVVSTLFNYTKKPTIFVFDDLDRVNDPETIVKILDALVAFLSIKNSVYIIPVDESKVMKAINEMKPNEDAYSYMNKYFNYSVRVPFIPAMNVQSMIHQNLTSISTKEASLSPKHQKIIAPLISPTYRSVKDFFNSFLMNKFTLSQINKFKNEEDDCVDAFKDSVLECKNLEDLIDDLDEKGEKLSSEEESKNYFILLGTILQIRFPLLVDFFAKDINNATTFFDELSKNENIFTKLLAFLISPGSEINFEDIKSNSKTEIYSNMLSSIMGYKVNQSNINNDFKNFIIDGTKKEKDEGKDKDKIIKNAKIIKRLKLIIEVKNKFKINIDTINHSFSMAAWMASTLANIENEIAIKYLKNADIAAALAGDSVDVLKKLINPKTDIESEEENE